MSVLGCGIMEKENENNKTLTKSFTENLNELDTIPLYLSPLEREVLILFVNEVSNISSLHIQRVIQTSYLFRIADLVGLAFDLNGSPYLMNFIRAFKQYKALKSKEEFFDAIEKLEKYLSAEGKINAEIKRQKLITEVNKLVPKFYSIPSYKAINTVLQSFEKRGYIQKTQTDRKTLWSINPDFYAKWSARRHQLFDEREQKVKEYQNTGIPSDQAEIKANEFMLDKYGVIVLDFYNINYVPYRINAKMSDLKVASKESLYLRYREDIGIFSPK